MHFDLISSIVDCLIYLQQAETGAHSEVLSTFSRPAVGSTRSIQQRRTAAALRSPEQTRRSARSRTCNWHFSRFCFFTAVEADCHFRSGTDSA